MRLMVNKGSHSTAVPSERPLFCLYFLVYLLFDFGQGLGRGERGGGKKEISSQETSFGSNLPQ